MFFCKDTLFAQKKEKIDSFCSTIVPSLPIITTTTATTTTCFSPSPLLSTMSHIFIPTGF
ncbi:hypothetical protein PP707_06850 [Acetobacter pasteurianus]|nr:hypothetical protein [Acetobacter pasteurianus]